MKKDTPRAFWQHWAAWFAAKVAQFGSNDRLRRDLDGMSERDLRDIGLIRSDVPRITHGQLPPTERPLRRRPAS